MSSAGYKSPTPVARRDLSAGLARPAHRPGPENPALPSRSRSGPVLGEGGVNVIAPVSFCHMSCVSMNFAALDCMKMRTRREVPRTPVAPAVLRKYSYSRRARAGARAPSSNALISYTKALRVAYWQRSTRGALHLDRSAYALAARAELQRSCVLGPAHYCTDWCAGAATAAAGDVHKVNSRTGTHSQKRFLSRVHLTPACPRLAPTGCACVDNSTSPLFIRGIRCRPQQTAAVRSARAVGVAPA